MHNYFLLDGWYMLIDSSNPKQSDQKGRLISPQIYLSSNLTSCLIFSKYMHGDDVEALKVIFKTESEIYGILTFNGNEGDYWVTMHSEFQTAANVRFQVLILRY
jgi:hypothetical protein